VRYLLVLTVVIAAGCSERSEPAPPPPAPAPAEGDIERARAAAMKLGKTLKTRLVGAMQDGPPAAVRVCSEEARSLTTSIATETGVRVGRSSLRLRNPDNAGPPWVTAWLREQGERPAQGTAGVATVEAGTARFLAPIAVEGFCLTCHGPPDAIPPEVRDVLRERYPTDRAVGYAAGDLRGALWAEAPIEGR
jgi:hypothetical protein